LSREIFVKNSSTNELYKEGDLMKRIKLGRTLRQISEEGVETFYNGNLAKKIISEIQKKGFLKNISLFILEKVFYFKYLGGILTLDDLRRYNIDFQEALSVDLNDSLKVFTSTAPSSGPIMTFILNIMTGLLFTLFYNDL
jgi:gamma-glutamyltranspeptidase